METTVDISSFFPKRNQNENEAGPAVSEAGRAELREIKTVQCTICLDDVGDTDRVVTKCGHIFHASCLFENNTHANTCPNCREPIAPKPKQVPKMKKEVASAIVQQISNVFPVDVMVRGIYEDFMEGLQVTSTSNHPPGNGKILPNDFNNLPNTLRSTLETNIKYAIEEMGLKTCQDVGLWIKHYNDDEDYYVEERERSRSPSPEPITDEEYETDPEMPDLILNDDIGDMLNDLIRTPSPPPPPSSPPPIERPITQSRFRINIDENNWPSLREEYLLNEESPAPNAPPTPVIPPTPPQVPPPPSPQTQPQWSTAQHQYYSHQQIYGTPPYFHQPYVVYPNPYYMHTHPNQYYYHHWNASNVPSTIVDRSNTNVADLTHY